MARMQTLRAVGARLGLRHRVARARVRLEAWLRSRLPPATERVIGSTVVVTEYPAHPRPRWGWGQPPNKELEARLSSGRHEYRRLLEDLVELLPRLRAIPRHADDPSEPAWENPYFGGLDAVALYGFITRRRPRSYTEVGSGYSTRFARRAIEDVDLKTTITSIDPMPRAEIDTLCDEIHRSGLEDVPLDVFDRLGGGDILLVDGSHLAHMNSDAVVAFTEVLPRLAPGVLIGIDDVFLPWDYPPSWERRWYAEQYLLASAILSDDRRWRVILPAWWVSIDPELAPQVGCLADPAGYDTPIVENPPGRPVNTFGKTFWMERAADG